MIIGTMCAKWPLHQATVTAIETLLVFHLIVNTGEPSV